MGYLLGEKNAQHYWLPVKVHRGRERVARAPEQPWAWGTSLGTGTGRGCAMGLQVGPVLQDPWLGRAGLWGSGDRC